MNTFQKTLWSLPQFLRRQKLVKLLTWLFPSLRLSEAHFNGRAKAVLPLLNDAWAQQVFLTGIFEPWFFPTVNPFIPTGGLVLDIGANLGLCSFGLCALRPREDIMYALFEPNPDLTHAIGKSICLNAPEKVSLFHSCVGETSYGYSDLSVNKKHTGAGHVVLPGMREVNVSASKIPNIAIDDFLPAFMRENQRSAVDLMKIDVEGSELAVLLGARRCLEKGLIKAICLEFSLETLRRQGASPTSLLRVLEETGFQVFHCRNDDFEFSPELKNHSLRITGYNSLVSVELARISPPFYSLLKRAAHRSTDILAVHQSSNLFAKIQAQVHVRTHSLQQV